MIMLERFEKKRVRGNQILIGSQKSTDM